MGDRIEFYDEKTGKLVASVKSSMVPTVGKRISIRKQTWEVERVTFALDHADDPALKNMRCNVDLSKVRVR
jgi:hypothetical protein